jgi:uncharacterized RDD family membrane protein YckC
VTQRVVPASLNARLFAFITDGIPLLLAGWVAFFTLDLDALQFGLFNFIAFQLFFTAFWWLNRGQTPGMRMVGIRVVALEGRRLSLWQAVIRSLVLYIASPIAVVTALLRQDQRGVHDLAARTEVVVK